MSKNSRVRAALFALLGAASISAALAPLASANPTSPPASRLASPAGHGSARPSDYGEIEGHAPVIASPTENQQFNQAPPPLTVEQVDPGATDVTLYEWDEDEFLWKPVASTATKIGSEKWSVSPEHPLAFGRHSLAVTQTLEVEFEEGVEVEAEGALSEGVDINIDTEAPTLELPLMTGSVTENEPFFHAQTGLGNFGEDTNNKIAFYVDGAKVAAEPVEEAGNAYYRLETPLTDGPHEAYARTIDDEGHESTARSEALKFTTHTTPAPVITAPSAGASLTTNTPTVTMTGPPSGNVGLYLDGEWVGANVSLDAQGNASYTFTTALAAGQHTLVAQATDWSGLFSEFSPAVTFTINAAPAAPSQPTPAPQPQPQPQPKPTPTPTPPPAQPQRLTLSSHTLTQSQPVKLGFVVSHPGTVQVTLMRLVHHHWLTVGTVSVNVKAGHGSYTLQKRFGGHTLKPGSYQVSLQTKSGHAHSKAVNAQLSVH
jgi:large repetitive protein